MSHLISELGLEQCSRNYLSSSMVYNTICYGINLKSEVQLYFYNNSDPDFQNGVNAYQMTHCHSDWLIIVY